MGHIQISSEIEAFLVRRANDARPQEACGFILEGSDGRYVPIEIDNVALDPTASFVMDKEQFAQLWHDGMSHRIVAIWHTHPKDLDRPSAGDFETMRHPNMIMSHWDYLVVSLDKVTHWDPSLYGLKDDSFWDMFVH